MERRGDSSAASACLKSSDSSLQPRLRPLHSDSFSKSPGICTLPATPRRNLVGLFYILPGTNVFYWSVLSLAVKTSVSKVHIDYWTDL